ncbi:carbohydrate ABC transporter membrane protein 1 (CUT1 family) [Mobilisporobacter senegalensis]|uniref:Maltose/maltodextrin transport system permease protein n=1 Tax=Mobilisporobacter senegalensis TaxID=1329262 RepID=A0A3N1XL57_9FIRM|nr:sugar ABC transporter permease [Mobilisporobacter senegalensis]ROR27416.1 carbohydrate ABC transporter membrane protein 1 (CUT1 family) [Mobilisporobacter senegalensis]
MGYKEKANPFKVLLNKFKWIGTTFHKGDNLTKLSFVIMGLSNLLRGQIIKGLTYMVLEISFIFYTLIYGINNFIGLLTLGTKQQNMVYNEESGIYEVLPGDNSMIMLLAGVTTLFVILFFIVVWVSSIKSAIHVQELKEKGKKIPNIVTDITSLFNTNIHKLLLTIPIIGLVLFTVVPLVYMILMAFTNYDVNHQPPGNLFTWIGLKNFKLMLLSNDKIAKTFWPVFGWTMVWAFFATFTCYFGGMLLAILINSKGIRGKGFWRTIFVITIAVPSFVSLLIIRVMLAEHGALNILLQELGFITKALPFFTNPTWARVTVIIVNLWVGIPHTMLITTGILTNIPADLYESAKIDGASPIKTFLKITMPYMLFITTPYLITNFIANINNFNAIYFLTEGNPATLDYFKGAGKTDLLVTWLFKLTIESKDYCYASTIGIMIFTISAALSLIVYRRTGAYKNEEGFQ